MNIHHFAFSLPTSQGDRKGRPGILNVEEKD